MKDRYKNSLLTPQELLVPVNIDVPREVTDELAEDGIPLLSAMGFEIEHFGGNTFVVRSAPEYLDYRDVGATVMGFVETLEENPDTHAVDFIDRAIKQMACKSSVRSGDGLSKEEVEKLLEDWEKTPDRFSCPHGRPVAFFLSRKDIEKQFKRLGF
jgi:DNA mismatch repair protein MutL